MADFEGTRYEGPRANTGQAGRGDGAVLTAQQRIDRHHVTAGELEAAREAAATLPDASEDERRGEDERLARTGRRKNGEADRIIGGLGVPWRRQVALMNLAVRIAEDGGEGLRAWDGERDPNGRREGAYAEGT